MAARLALPGSQHQRREAVAVRGFQGHPGGQAIVNECDVAGARGQVKRLRFERNGDLFGPFGMDDLIDDFLDADLASPLEDAGPRRIDMPNIGPGRNQHANQVRVLAHDRGNERGEPACRGLVYIRAASDQGAGQGENACRCDEEESVHATRIDRRGIGPGQPEQVKYHGLRMSAGQKKGGVPFRIAGIDWLANAKALSNCHDVADHGGAMEVRRGSLRECDSGRHDDLVLAEGTHATIGQGIEKTGS